jgi:hypothetical protein
LKSEKWKNCLVELSLDERDALRALLRSGRCDGSVSFIGLLTDASGFPLMVNAFEGNTAETKTMLASIEAFMTVHQLREVTVVADAGMISESNKRAIEDAGLSFILGTRITHIPYVVDEWRRQHPGQEIPDGHILTQPWPAAPTDKRRDQVIYYQYRADRARRTLRGIDEQVAKAERAVAGKTCGSNATGSSNSRAGQGKSTETWRPRPEPSPGSRATPPTSKAPPPSS